MATISATTNGTADSGPATGGHPVRPEHLASQVALVTRHSTACVVAVRATGPWTGGATLDVQGQRWTVAECPSALAVREALVRHDAAEQHEGAHRLVVLTPVPEAQLGLDVLARLAKQQVLPMEPWGVLLDLFRAHSVDPRVAQEPWMAEVLLEHMPAQGFAPVASGVLDADTVWGHLLRAVLGLTSGRPDAVEVLMWSADPARVALWGRLPDAARSPVRRRLCETAGRIAESFVAALDADSGLALLPIGLACEVLFPSDGNPSGDLARATVRLEPMLGGRLLEAADGRRWFASARRALDRLDPVTATGRLLQAEALLRELRAEAYVAASTMLPAGYVARRAAFGRALGEWLDGRGTLDGLRRACARVAEHREAAQEPEHSERLTMAVRLARWLDMRRETPSREVASLAVRARDYQRDASWADWARTMLLGSEADAALAGPLATLLGRVREERERENRRFAEGLAEWSRLPNAEPGMVPVERVLEDVVALVASRAPVLVLVVDGLDHVVMRQLRRDLQLARWVAWMPAGVADDAWAGIAVVPSVTGFSRATLLTGRVGAGNGGDEVRGFSGHPTLLRVSRPKRAPVLFHKGALGTDGVTGLATEVRERLQDPEQRVVGAVLNAVDDYLAKSDQVRPSWSTDRIPLLQQLLFEADVAGRAVVLLSDHGHVLEADTRQLGGGDDDRWRLVGDPIASEELVIEGSRVQEATGLARVVVPWSEAVRYTRRKAGYHGGATPQEVVVPILVLARAERPLDGWRPVQDAPPTWWGGADVAPEVTTPVVASVSAAPAPGTPPLVTRGRSKGGSVAAQPTLFGEPDSAPAGRGASTTGNPSAWLDALLVSPVYAAQRELAGRLAPPDVQVREVLGVLDARHGRAPRALVARVLGMPEFRVRGPLAGMQRLLNVDGYQVLAVDEGTGTVTLDRTLLRTQFQLGDGTRP